MCNAILFFSVTFVIVSLPVSFGLPSQNSAMSHDDVAVDKNGGDNVQGLPSHHERVEVEGVWQIVLVVFLVILTFTFTSLQVYIVSLGN